MAMIPDSMGARGACFGQIEVAARAARTYTRLLVRLSHRKVSPGKAPPESDKSVLALPDGFYIPNLCSLSSDS